MQNILDAMRKSISQHYRGNKMIGSIAVSCVKEFFQLEKKADEVVRDKEPVEGYVRNGKLFLRVEEQEIKIQLFRRKGEILSLINDKLTSLGYQHTLDDIYIK